MSEKLIEAGKLTEGELLTIVVKLSRMVCKQMINKAVQELPTTNQV